jgi:plasmid stabilization system protein ParE
MPEKFQVSITHTAQSDIKEIWDFIAADNLRNAIQFLLELEDQIATVERFP